MYSASSYDETKICSLGPPSLTSAYRLAAALLFGILPGLSAQLADPAIDTAKPDMNVYGGFFTAPFSLSINSATLNAVIYYSLDGSDPGPGSGSLYTAPVQITNTTILRARAFRDGFRPSEARTQTYLFLDDVIHQAPDGRAPPYFPSTWGANAVDYGMDPNVVSRYSLDEWREALTQIPSISIVTDLKNLFDPATGIYANALQHGETWERPASIELLHPTAVPQQQFQEDCGLRIRGGYSRNSWYPKHSFRVFFRGEYGATKLRYALFEDQGADKFDTFDLRTSQNYSWAIDSNTGHYETMVREVFCRETLGAMGQPTTRSRYYHLYLNGQYWGLYETQERPEASYGATYLGGSKEDYDVVKCSNHVGAFVTEVTDGNLDAFRSLWTMARAVAANPDNANYFAILGCNADGTRNLTFPVLLEVDNLIDYMLVIFYTGDGDATLSSFLNNERPNNWFGMRNRNNPDRGFIFFNHDAEHTLGAPHSQVDRTGPFPSPNQNTFSYANPQWIHEDLMHNAEYRLRFADHVQRHFFNDAALTPETATSRFLRKAAQIDKAIRAYSARWGDAQREPPYGETDWRSMIDSIVQEWFPPRTSLVLQQLKQDGLYPSPSAPLFDQRDVNGSSASELTMTHTNASGTIYFTTDGSDPRVVGGAVRPGARVYSDPLPILNTTRVLARVRDGTNWSALSEAEFAPASDPVFNARISIRTADNGVTLDFAALAEIRYALQYRDDFTFGSWRVLTNIPAAPANRLVSVRDPVTAPNRFYRIGALRANGGGQ
jgi:hypothetical protein